MGLASDLRAGRAAIEVHLDQNPLNRGLAELSRTFGGFAGRLKSIGSLGAVGPGGGVGGLIDLFIGARFTRALLGPLRLSANLEKVRASMTALTGDAASAGRIVDELTRFSRISIIDLPNLERGAELLLGFGESAETVVPVVKAIAAVARGDGERFQRLSLAIAQITAATRLQGQEARQLAESGLPILSLVAQKTGESLLEVKDRMADGAISAREVRDVLMESANEGGRFGSILEDVSNTVIGQFNKLRASLNLVAMTLGDAALPLVFSFLQTLNDYVPSMLAAAEANAGFYPTLLLSAGAAAGLLGSVFALGLGMQLLSFTVGGLAIGVSSLTSLLGLAMTPAGGLAAVAVLIARNWSESIPLVGKLLADESRAWAGNFRDVAGYGIAAFRSIANALAAGEIDTAAEVAVAGVNVAFQRMFMDLRAGWNRLIADIAKGLVNLASVVPGGKSLLGLPEFDRKSDPAVVAEKQKLDDLRQQKRDAVGAEEKRAVQDLIDEQVKAYNAAIAKGRAALLSGAFGAIDEGAEAKIEELARKLEEAIARFEELKGKADNLEPPEIDFGGARPGLLNDLEALDSAGRSLLNFERRQGLFGRGLNQRADVVGRSLAERQLSEAERQSEHLESIDRNLMDATGLVVG